MHTIKNYLLLALVLAFSSKLMAQVDKPSPQLMELFSLDGMLVNHTTIVDRMLDDYKTDFEHIPEAFWNKQQKALDSEFETYIHNEVIKIYNKNMSDADIVQSIKLIKENNTKNLGDAYLLSHKQALDFAQIVVGTISQKLSNNIEASTYFENNINPSDCLQFRNGNFKIYMSGNTVVEIEKKDSIQYSRIGTNFIKFNITYFNDCDYKLTIIETNFPHLQNDIGQSIEIYPYTLVGNKMKYKSIMPETDDFVNYGELIK